VDTGKFVSPEGTPFDQRALPNSTLDKPHTRYEVVKPIPDVDSGKAAPWFDKPG
jgi:filamentous hemagglutinin